MCVYTADIYDPRSDRSNFYHIYHEIHVKNHSSANTSRTNFHGQNFFSRHSVMTGPGLWQGLAVTGSVTDTVSVKCQCHSLWLSLSVTVTLTVSLSVTVCLLLIYCHCHSVSVSETESWKGMTKRQTTAIHHKPPQTTANHHKPPHTTANHHKPPPEFGTIIRRYDRVPLKNG